MSTTLRIVEPVQKTDYEMFVLGCIFWNAELLLLVLGILTPEDFDRAAHQIIFQAMIDLDAEGKPVDIYTVYEHLKAQGEPLEQVGGSTYLTYLTSIVPSIVNAEFYANEVRDAANARKRVEGSIRATQGFREGIDPHQVLTGLIEIVLGRPDFQDVLFQSLNVNQHVR